MGLFDIFRMGKVLAGTVKAVRNQRKLAQDLAALPTVEFIDECLVYLNNSAGNWHGSVKPPHPEVAVSAAAKQLSAELQDFYRHCDGFASPDTEFPVRLHGVQDLRTGGDYAPKLSARLTAYWSEWGNDAEQAGMLAVMPPDDLAALATNAAETHITLADLDKALSICVPTEREFVVVLREALSEKLPAGTIIDVENGAATRYPGFKQWLAARASLFGAMGGT